MPLNSAMPHRETLRHPKRHEQSLPYSMITIFNLRVVQKCTKKQEASRHEKRSIRQTQHHRHQSCCSSVPLPKPKELERNHPASGAGQAREGSQPSVPFENARVEARGSCSRMQTADTIKLLLVAKLCNSRTTDGDPPDVVGHLPPCECLGCSN